MRPCLQIHSSSLTDEAPLSHPAAHRATLAKQQRGLGAFCLPSCFQSPACSAGPAQVPGIQVAGAPCGLSLLPGPPLDPSGSSPTPPGGECRKDHRAYPSQSPAEDVLLLGRAARQARAPFLHGRGLSLHPGTEPCCSEGPAWLVALTFPVWDSQRLSLPPRPGLGSWLGA